MALNKQLVAGLVIFVLLAASATYKLLQQNEQGITATGTVEVTRRDIMPKTNGYIQSFSIQVGDQLQTGQIVARLNRTDLTAQVVRDEAALSRAIAQLRDLTAGDRPQERQQLVANMAAAQATYVNAQADYDRYAALAGIGAIATQQLDTARTARDVAYNSFQAAKERLSLSDAGTRPETLEAQRLEVERSRAVLAASQSLLEDVVVTSPAAGLVLSKNYENGEYIAPGAALVTIGDMSDCWVKVYVSSAQLGLVSIGQEATVKVDSFPTHTFRGVVKEISQNAEFTPRQTITQRERANMVFAVKVKIDNGDGKLKPGMPADVVLQ